MLSNFFFEIGLCCAFTFSLKFILMIIAELVLWFKFVLLSCSRRRNCSRVVFQFWVLKGNIRFGNSWIWIKEVFTGFYLYKLVCVWPKENKEKTFKFYISFNYHQEEATITFYYNIRKLYMLLWAITPIVSVSVR